MRSMDLIYIINNPLSGFDAQMELINCLHTVVNASALIILNEEVDGCERRAHQNRPSLSNLCFVP